VRPLWTEDDCARSAACPFLVAGTDGFCEDPVRQLRRACADGSKEGSDGSFHPAAGVECSVEGPVEVGHAELEREGTCERGGGVMELAVCTDDVVVGCSGDRFLERGSCSLEFDQPCLDRRCAASAAVPS
jgi:hypothetical protein